MRFIFLQRRFADFSQARHGDFRGKKAREVLVLLQDLHEQLAIAERVVLAGVETRRAPWRVLAPVGFLRLHVGLVQEPKRELPTSAKLLTISLLQSADRVKPNQLGEEIYLAHLRVHAEEAETQTCKFLA